MVIQRQFQVYGTVQGVGFRYFTWCKATKLGLTGTVRNQADGSVAIVAEGEEAKIHALHQWLLQGGVRSARVERILIQPYQGNSQQKVRFSEFAIRY